MINGTRIRGTGLLAAAVLALVALGAPAVTVAVQPDARTATTCESPSAACVIPAADGPGSEPPSEEAATGETPSDEAPDDESPPGEAQSTPAPTDGEVVYDGPFLTPTPDPTPAGVVLDATGAPAMTPPSTDTPDGHVAQTAGSSLWLLLVAVAGLPLLVLRTGRSPVARRS